MSDTNYVNFWKGSKAEYKELQKKEVINDNTLYFISEGAIYKGNTLMGENAANIYLPLVGGEMDGEIKVVQDSDESKGINLGIFGKIKVEKITENGDSTAQENIIELSSDNSNLSIGSDSFDTILKGKQINIKTSDGKTPKLGNEDKGSSINPIYLSEGHIVESNETVGSGINPIYLNEGTVTESTATVGSPINPIYLKDGEMIISNETVGSGINPIYLNEGEMTASNETIGSNKAPVYLNEGAITEVSIIDVPHGGTGQNSFDKNFVLMGQGQNAIESSKLKIETATNENNEYTKYGTLIDVSDINTVTSSEYRAKISTGEVSIRAETNSAGVGSQGLYSRTKYTKDDGSQTSIGWLLRATNGSDGSISTLSAPLWKGTGGSKKFIYFNSNGVPIVSTATEGASNKPVYLNGGELTAITDLSVRNITASGTLDVTGATTLSSTLTVNGMIAGNLTGNVTGNATTADLLNLHDTTNLSTRKSNWNGSAPSTIKSYPWRQAFLDSSIGSDSGDLVLGLRNGIYVSGGTELCMFIDGDYYSMGKKVYSERDGFVVPGIKKATAVSALGWGTNNNYVPDLSMIAFWNGAYSGTSSNLAYCNKGAFGTIVTKNAGDYLLLSGGTLSGTLNMNNNKIINIGDLSFNDPGTNEGITWTGGNGWWIYESPDNLTNDKGNLQFVQGSTRRLTVRTDGRTEATGEIVSTSANAFRSIWGSRGFFVRNDGDNVYFMLTNSGDAYGNWNSLRPLMINCSTGEVRIATSHGITNGNSPCAVGYGTNQTGAANCYLTAGGGINKTPNSSRLIKDNIEDLKNEDINAKKLYDLKVRQFIYKKEILNENDCRYGKLLPGFIVEELNEIYPILIDKENENSKNWDWNVKYLVPPMLKLIQDQKKEIDELKNNFENQKKRISELENLVLKLIENK